MSSQGSLPQFRLAITGHRNHHPDLIRNGGAIEKALRDIVATVAATIRDPATTNAPVHRLSLVGLMADGVDRMTVKIAGDAGAAIQAILPFGRALTAALARSPGADQKTASPAHATAAEIEDALAACSAGDDHDAYAACGHILSLADNDDAIIAHAHLRRFNLGLVNHNQQFTTNGFSANC